MEGYDIVSARPLESYTRFTSKCFYKLFNRYSNLANTLATEKFHIISRRAINCIQSYTNINLYRKAVYLASGMSTSYVAYIPDKKQAVVYLNNGFRMNTASDALVLFTNFAYKISIYLSIIMAFVMLGFGLYTTIVYFGGHKPVEGWAPIMGLISLGFMGIFVIMAFIFKYLEVLLRLTFKKQRYIVSKIEKL